MKTTTRLWSVRGAICLTEHGKKGIEAEMIARVEELLEKLMLDNGMGTDDMVNIQFTQTEDIDFMNAATAARSGKLEDRISRVPLFCAQEPRYPNALPRTIRVMVTYYQVPGHVPTPAYLYGAEQLRKDLHEN